MRVIFSPDSAYEDDTSHDSIIKAAKEHLLSIQEVDGEEKELHVFCVR